MRQLVVLLLFNLLFFFVSAQKKMQISVSSWVVKPNVEDFEKPLIFIDFWATWCGPCISSMPHTESLMNDFKDDVLFLYVSNEPSGKVARFMKKKNKFFFSAIDSTGNNIENFNIKTLPNSVLLDFEGNVIWKGKPNEMDKSLLKRFVSLFKYEKGKFNRIVKIASHTEKLNWKYFYYNSMKLKYINTVNVANEFSKASNNEFYISGDIKYFISTIKNVPISQIKSEVLNNEKYMISCNVDSIKKFYNIVEEFINEKCRIIIQEREEKKKIYVLESTGNENFFSNKMYNFEKGDNTYLVDDLTIMIDNATVREMTETLSEFSEQTFLFIGDDENKYDWNIHYKYNKFTIEQLSSELNFIITKEKKKIKYYYLYNVE